jgi:hypothetical protein
VQGGISEDYVEDESQKGKKTKYRKEDATIFTILHAPVSLSAPTDFLDSSPAVL